MHTHTHTQAYTLRQTHTRPPEGHEGQLLGAKLVLIQQYMGVARPVGALDASMAVQVEVKLCGVADVPVNQSACTNTTFSLVKKLNHGKKTDVTSAW